MDNYSYFSQHCTSHAAVHLGRLMFPLFARALELPEDFFEDKAGAQNVARFYSSDHNVDEACCCGNGSPALSSSNGPSR